MFQHAFQSGNYIEVFDAKINKEKDKNYEKLFKQINPNGFTKTFDKITKGYIYELDDALKTKLQFPKNDKQELALVQHFLVFQIFLPVGAPFSLEVVVTDTTKNKRRLNFTTSLKTIDKTYFHAKIPVDAIRRGVWLNLSLDLISFFELFKGHTFRSIDAFVLGAVCKLRRIYTMKHPIAEFSSDDEFSNQVPEAQMAPKSQNFPAGVPYVNQLLTLEVVQKESSHHQDIRDLNTSDDSISKNSTNISQAMKVKGLISTGTRDLKPNNNTNITTQTSGRLYAKQDDRKSLKNAFIATKTGNTLYSDHERKQSLSKERNGMNDMLQVKGVSKKNNLLTSHDLDKQIVVNASDDEDDQRTYDSPSKYEESTLTNLSSPKINSQFQRNTSQTRNNNDPRLRNSSSKYKKNTIVGNNQDEEEKDDKNKVFRKRESSVNKNDKAVRDSKNLLGQKVPNEPKSATEPHPTNNASQSRRINSATNKIIKNDVKTLSSNSNPWNQGSMTKTTPTKNPVEQHDNKKFDPKKKSPQVQSQNQKASNSKQSKSEVKKSNNDFEKTGFSESSDRFNTTGKFSNQRYDPTNRSGDHDFDQWQMVDEIEENLEYELASNASGMNGTRGFSDFNNKKEREKDTPDYIIGIETKAGRGPSNKTPQKDTNTKYKANQSPKRPLMKQDEDDQKEGLGYQYGKARDIYEMLSHSPELEDSLNSPGFKSKVDSNQDGNQNNKEEKKKIDALESQVQNMVSKIRPYSPPYSFAGAGDNTNATVITRKNDEVIVVKKEESADVKNIKNGTNNEMLEVIYDPVWNCYYHPKTNTYYEMKE